MLTRCTIFIFIVLLVDVVPLHGASFYVDAINGSDKNAGTDPNHAWSTIAKVNSQIFRPGDAVLFKRGAVWEEQLTAPSSGAEDSPITFGAYGTGNNPLIKTSNSFRDWISFISRDRVQVWKGKIKGVLNSWGAVKDGSRLPIYTKYNKALPIPQSLAEMKVGYFYAPLHKGGFYLRNDVGKPTGIEIGARKFGIHIKNKSYIVIEGIDVSGPGGREDPGGQLRFGLIVADNSDHITIKHSTVSNHALHGILITAKSTNCTVQDVTAYGHGSTGVYFAEGGEGNKAICCHIFKCGASSTDRGDMGMIGVLQTPGVVIDGCFVHDNGHPGIQKIDAAISIVASSNCIVSRCYVKNAGGTAIQFAHYSDHGMAAYNVIDRWAVYGNVNSHNEGIRIGGGHPVPTAKGCEIYNNLFINGGAIPGEWAALRILDRDNDGLQVKNNIFHDNVGVYEIKAESRNRFTNWVFSNNLFYRTRGDPINWGGKVYDHSHIIGNTINYYSFDQKQDGNSIAADPKLLDGLRGLNPNSPCIGNGTDVGLLRDFYNNPVPSGTGINIGPFQTMSGQGENPYPDQKWQ